MAQSYTIDPALQPIADSFVVFLLRIIEGCEERWASISCFAIELRGAWYLVTAAHALEDIEMLLASDNPPKVSYYLHVHAQEPARPLDFAYMNASVLKVPDLAEHWLNRPNGDPSLRDAGNYYKNVDAALIDLDQYYQGHLTAMGVCPLSGPQLSTPSVAALSKAKSVALQFFLCGAPYDGLQVGNNGRGYATIKFLEIWPRTFDSPNYEFEPSWDEALHYGSVKGMSGGPVVAVVNGMAHLLGLQSREIIAARRGPRLLKVTDTENLLTLISKAA